MSRLAHAGIIAIAAAVVCAHAASPIRVMLVDGESAGAYHKWRTTTPVLKKELDETGMFEVDVVTAPAVGTDFSGFSPAFNRYQVVVLNYDAPDDRWPASLKSSFDPGIVQHYERALDLRPEGGDAQIARVSLDAHLIVTPTEVKFNAQPTMLLWATFPYVDVPPPR